MLLSTLSIPLSFPLGVILFRNCSFSLERERERETKGWSNASFSSSAKFEKLDTERTQVYFLNCLPVGSKCFYKNPTMTDPQICKENTVLSMWKRHYNSQAVWRASKGLIPIRTERSMTERLTFCFTCLDPAVLLLFKKTDLHVWLDQNQRTCNPAALGSNPSHTIYVFSI